ncbi:MAG TPA: PAS domain-containing protein [Gemmatimonadaceae bacterium]
MIATLQNPIVWMVTAVLLLAAGFYVGQRRGSRRTPAATDESPAVSEPRRDDRIVRRAASIDALAEAVLITDGEGRVLDCNSSALNLFDRHRGAMEDQVATTLRRFDGLDQAEPHRIAAERAVWVGEAWARQPDGAMRLCHVRVAVIRDERSRIAGYAESYRDVAQDRQNEQEFRDLLYGVRAFDPANGTYSDSLEALREDVRVLSEAFRDLDHVLRQYERLLPSMSADDPLAESIAGLAHDARAAVASVGVPSLLEEIPRALARMRGHLQIIASELQARTTDPDARTGTRPTGARQD